jgi:uncharacterized protein YjaZ
VVGGQSRKMAQPIFGRGLAVWCERSEHDKSQIFYKQTVRLLRFVKFDKIFNFIFFKVALLLGCPRIAPQRVYIRNTLAHIRPYR